MRGPLTWRLIQALDLAYSFTLEKKKKLVRDLSIWAPLWNKQRKKIEKLDPRMRKCDEHQTLVHLDVHVCPVFVCMCVCLCVCVCVGGGYSHLYIYIYIYMKIPQNIEIKRFWTFKNGMTLLCVKISESSFPPPPPPRKYVSTRGNGLSKWFIYLGK